MCFRAVMAALLALALAGCAAITDPGPHRSLTAAEIVNGVGPDLPASQQENRP